MAGAQICHPEVGQINCSKCNMHFFFSSISTPLHSTSCSCFHTRPACHTKLTTEHGLDQHPSAGGEISYTERHSAFVEVKTIRKEGACTAAETGKWGAGRVVEVRPAPPRSGCSTGAGPAAPVWNGSRGDVGLLASCFLSFSVLYIKNKVWKCLNVWQVQHWLLCLDLLFQTL